MQILNPQRVPPHEYTPAPQMRVPNHSILPKIPLTDTTPPKALNFSSSIPNIIVFGETGVGKSSIINMIQGGDVATTSNSAYGCTSESSHHEAILASPSGKKKYRLWDTSGLNEGEKGTVPAQKAMSNLVALVRELRANEGSAGGVSLLVYCIRGARLREIIRVNYDLFWGIICNGQVPIVLVITGLENEDDMDGWWRDNRVELEDVMGMTFQGHACVTSTKGKIEKSGRYMFEEEYQESVRKVRNLVESACALHPEPLRIDGETWIADIEWRLKHYLSEYTQRTGQERRALTDSYNSRKSRDPGILDGRTTRDPGFLAYLMGLLHAFLLHMTFGSQVEDRGASQYHDVPSVQHPGNHTSPAYGTRGTEQLVSTSDRHHPVSKHPNTPSTYVQGKTQASVPISSVVPGPYVGTTAASARYESQKRRESTTRTDIPTGDQTKMIID